MYPLINDKLKNTPYKVCLAVTGGGTGAIDKLLKYGGGSSTLIDAYVPYDIDRLTKFLKKEPEKCCSIETARAMAMESYKLACVDNDPKMVLGVGATCKLRKIVNERSGREHTIHIAVQGESFTESFDFILGPTAKTIRIREMGRVEEEDLCADTIIMCIAIACGLEEYQIPLQQTFNDDYTHTKAVDYRGFRDVIFGSKKAMPWFNREPAPYIFSGSFNPIHDSHLHIIKVAKEKYGKVDVEISVSNVDKGVIDYHDIIMRISKILKYCNDGTINNIWLTNLPLFSMKGEYFPNTTFLVGSDTLIRLDDDKYYGNDKVQQLLYKDDVMRGFINNNINFLVFTRKKYKIDANTISKKLLDRCTVIKSEVYIDKGISSTQIRKMKK